jgi:hypothetical protein
MKFFKINIFYFIFLFISQLANAQFFGLFSGKANEKHYKLLQDRSVQIESTKAINAMYDFRFDEAEREFRWLTIKYPKHPIGNFLLGLNEWWKIVPNTSIETYDEACLSYMDKAIDLAEDLYDDDETDKEAAFFISAAYAFKGRLYSERSKWIKSAWAGKQAMKYLEKCRGPEDLNPELLFGDGLYNYYSKWIPENYPSLKPILLFFRKGTKQEGMRQLELVSNNAFYTRMESRYFLVQIYGMEGQHQKAYNLAKMMHILYPNNPFFHRYAARTAFVLGKGDEAETYSQELLSDIANQKLGYEGTAGRYAAYIIAYINQNYKHDIVKAKEYYQKTIDFAKETKSMDSGYFLASNLALGKMASTDKDYEKAKEYYKIVMDFAEKKSDSYKEAKKLLKTPYPSKGEQKK